MSIFRKHIALPTDHGSWIFLLSPLLIGLGAGRTWNISLVYLVVAALAAFLLRQPISITVKIYSRRRPRREISAAIFWIIVYGLIAALAVIGLINLGSAYIIILAIPGILIFTWHLYLISKRAERHQAGIEIVATGVLALLAPAAYWVAIGHTDLTGWLLWLLTWSQSAASIVYAYLRLNQRQLHKKPDLLNRLKMGSRALLYSSFNFISVLTLSITQVTPSLLPIAYAVQWLETIWGITNPALGVKPSSIGLRQMFISIIYTILFILAWNY